MKIVAIIFLAFAAALPVQASNVSRTPDERAIILCTTCSNILIQLRSPNQHAAWKSAVHPIHKISLSSLRSPIQPRIVGGNEVVPHSIPYQVALYIFRGLDLYFCGGSLITTTAVLTAAHCVEGASLAFVILGAHNINNDTEESRVTVISTTFVVHQGWNSTTLANDIALVTLAEPVPLNANIQLVKLPSRRDACDFFSGETATVSGWGLTATNSSSISPVLRSVSNPIITNWECSSTYPDLTPKHICMSGDGPKSTCFGDSGGPMMAQGANNFPVQTGIVSFIEESCESGLPQGYTRVGCYLDWLKANANVTITN